MNEITVAISGNPDAMGGLQPLVKIGETPFNLKVDVPFPAWVGGSYCIVVTHRQDGISYQYVANPGTVHSLGVSRPGAFWLGLTLPKNMRLAAPHTISDLLFGLVDKFRELYMTQRSDGSYEYKDGVYDRAPLWDYVRSFALTTATRYIPMIGQDTVCCPLASDEKIRAFLNDTQYAELGAYKCVITGLAGSNPSTGILSLDVPRPVNFKVFIKGRQYGTLGTANPVFEQMIPAEDKWHSDLLLKLSLDELRSCPKSARYEAMWDEQREEIQITPKWEKKIFKCPVEIVFSEDYPVDNRPKGEDFSLLFPDGRQRPLSSDSEGKYYLSYEGEEAAQPGEIKCKKGCKISVAPYIASEQQPVHISVTPYPAFQGIRFRQDGDFIRWDEESPVLKINFKNGETLDCELAVKSSMTFPLSGQKREDINGLELVSPSGKYLYGSLKTSYDELTGWMDVMLGTKARLADAFKPSFVIKGDNSPVTCNIEIVTERLSLLSRSINARKDNPFSIDCKEQIRQIRLTRVRDRDNGAYEDIVYSKAPSVKRHEHEIHMDDGVPMVTLHLSPFRPWLSLWRKVRKLFLACGVTLLLGFVGGYFLCRVLQSPKGKSSPEMIVQRDTIKLIVCPSDSAKIDKIILKLQGR